MFKNLPLKFFALFLAVIAWSAIVSNIEQVHTFREPIKVEFFNIPPELIVSSPEGLLQTDFFIRSDPKLAESLKPSDFRAYIDLSSAKAGTSILPIISSVDAPNTTVLRTEPSEIEVILEKKG